MGKLGSEEDTGPYGLVTSRLASLGVNSKSLILLLTVRPKAATPHPTTHPR